MHDRLRRARLLAGYHTAKAAIARFGWNASTYRAHENGQNKFSAGDARSYARAFKVNVSWLLFGDPAPSATPGDDGNKTTMPRPPDAHGDSRALCASVAGVPARDAHFDLSLETDELNDFACCGDILRFAPVVDPRDLSDGDIVAVERRTATGVDIRPQRVFFHRGRGMLAGHASAPAQMLANARILGKATWLMRRLDQ